MANVLILPGLHNSGPSHWQSIWLAAHPEYTRVVQMDWTRPRCEEWIRVLDEALGKEAPVLVAHSTACALVGHWWVRHKRSLGGALLGRSERHRRPLLSSWPSGLCSDAAAPPAVSDDRRGQPKRSGSLFQPGTVFRGILGGELIDLGAAGHINEKSGYGPWPDGHELVERLLSVNV